jgi:tetratricopeptide (TPR) repeat protein
MDWHELLTHLNKASDHIPVPPDWLNKLNTALLVVGTNIKDVPLPNTQIVALESIAARISGVLNIQRSVVLDQVLAKLCSAGTWSEVTQRAMIPSPQPLYSMDTEWGHLRESPFCSSLSDALFATLFDQGHSYDYQIRWLERTFLAHPTFLRAADHLSHMYWEEFRYREALEIIDSSLATILPLVDDSECLLDWYSGDNRPLLRLLYRQMEVRLALGDVPGALETAEYTLSLSPTDGVQIHLEIPKILRLLQKPNLAKAWTKLNRKVVLYHPVINGYWLTQLVALTGSESDTVPDPA